MKLPDSLFDDPNRLQPTRPDTEPQQPLLREERFDRKGVWRPRSASRSTGCGATSEVSAQRSYLYVFAHATQNRFKIGRSDVPLRRLAKLPEADQIDHVQSFRLELPDRHRSREVESMLHKALAAYRLKLTWFNASTLRPYQTQGWDGVTEWFSMSGLHHVMDLCGRCPSLQPSSAYLFKPWTASPMWSMRQCSFKRSLIGGATRPANTTWRGWITFVMSSC